MMPYEFLRTEQIQRVRMTYHDQFHEDAIGQMCASLKISEADFADVIWHAATSVGLDTSDEALAYGLQAVQTTIATSSHIVRGTDESNWHATVEPKKDWAIRFEQGIYNLTLARSTELPEGHMFRFQTTRLAEIGYLFTPDRDLFIKKVQKSDLDRGYRAKITPNMHPSDEELLQEKLRGDELFKIQDEIFSPQNDLSIEGWQVYSLLMSLAILGPHSSGRVHFIVPDAHPEVVRRQEELEYIEGATIHTPLYRKKRKQIKSERNRVSRLVDFGRLCQSSLGIAPDESPFPNHIQFSVEELLERAYDIFAAPYAKTASWMKVIRELQNAQRASY